MNGFAVLGDLNRVRCDPGCLVIRQRDSENPPNFPNRPDFLNNETLAFGPDGEEDPPPENFFPRISEDGVDFLGTGMGMLMMPPTPLGLIYLLLSLINFDTQQPNLDLGIQFAIAIVGWQGLEQAFMQMIALTNNLWREDYEKSIEKICCGLSHCAQSAHHRE